MVTREGDLPTKSPSWAANAFNSLWTGQVYTITWQLQQLMLAPCVQEWWNQPPYHWNHRIMEFLLLDSSGHGLQDACTVLRCSCRGKVPVNHKPCSLGRPAKALPRCQNWRQQVTRSVGPPQKFNTKVRGKCAGVFPWRNNNVLGQHTAVLHQNHQFCGFPLGLSMKWPNYPRFLVLEPTQINSAAASCPAEANPSEQLRNLFLTKELH